MKTVKSIVRIAGLKDKVSEYVGMCADNSQFSVIMVHRNGENILFLIFLIF
jgi:hypothetical protein